jgi:outer membrane protein OmpA-like peptidoglycan-associated protein
MRQARDRWRRLRLLWLALLAASPLAATEVSVNTIQFPEKKEIDVPFYALPPAPSGASMEAEVEAKGNQTTVDLSFEHLQPAVLLGGEVNSYVLWAITRDGLAENLGEVFDRSDRGKNKFQSAQKEFGMIVTAEIVPGVPRPSALIVFQSAAGKSKYAHNSQFPFSNFRPAPAHDVASIGTLHYTQDVPLELYQAQRIYDLAIAKGIDKYDARSMAEAKIALAQATNSTQRGGSNKSVTDYSRRTVSLVTSAGRAWMRAIQAQEAAAAEAKRAEELNALKAQSEKLAAEKAAAQEVAVRSEMARREAEESALQEEAARKEAEARTAEAQESAKAADAARLKSEDLRRQAEEQADAAEKARLQSEADAAALEAQRDDLASERDRIQKDRDALSQRLTGALQGIATTRSTARGVVVSLPGILFDTNKATLKPDAQIGLAKMAGVLSVFPDMNLRVEGYTDSTGTDEINLPLSRDRAESVAGFLRQQGVSAARIQTQGYGSQFPVASNETAQGRADNRRVEVIVAEGVVQAPGN